MICVAISDKSIDKCFATLDICQLAEIRLDLTEFNDEQIRKVFAHKTPTIATCRPDKVGTTVQLQKLKLAMESGARYVDIEYEADESLRKAVIQYARENKCKIIISYHNFMTTPALEELHQIAVECFNNGADIAKIATQANTIADAANLLSLYNIDKPIIALGMGEVGRITRIMAPMLGAEFTFAAMDDGIATAPGQIKYGKMKEIVDFLIDNLK